MRKLYRLILDRGGRRRHRLRRVSPSREASRQRRPNNRRLPDGRPGGITGGSGAGGSTFRPGRHVGRTRCKGCTRSGPAGRRSSRRRRVVRVHLSTRPTSSQDTMRIRSIGDAVNNAISGNRPRAASVKPIGGRRVVRGAGERAGEPAGWRPHGKTTGARGGAEPAAVLAALAGPGGGREALAARGHVQLVRDGGGDAGEMGYQAVPRVPVTPMATPQVQADVSGMMARSTSLIPSAANVKVTTAGEHCHFEREREGCRGGAADRGDDAAHPWRPRRQERTHIPHLAMRLSLP